MNKPKSLIQSQFARFCKQKINNLNCDFAIGQHWQENKHCTANFDDKRLKFLPQHAIRLIFVFVKQPLLKLDILFNFEKKICLYVKTFK